MLGGRWLLCVGLAWAAPYAVAQDVSRQAALDGGCIQLNRTVLDQLAGGQLEDAETALSAALASPANDPKEPCDWLILHNLAVVLGRSGRLAEAETLAERSIGILEKSHPPDDPVFLRPLQVLVSARFELRKMSKAREAFQRMQSIRAEGPEDRALVHGLAAALLKAEGRNREAELEYLKTLAAWEESGRGETADSASVLSGLGELYIADRRFEDAGRTLDRALAMFAAAADTVPTDRIKTLNCRALLRARLGKWPEAEQDLRSAVAMADREARLDPAEMESLLGNYAYVLRKDRRGKEAQAVEARAAAIRAEAHTDAVVDVSDLLAKK
jgi:tetratricopeptide (TPR) repeat protein